MRPRCCLDAQLEYVPQALSRICTNCGTLQDASQTQLANDEFQPGLWDPKTQIAQSASERNSERSRVFINTLAARIGHGGLAERTFFLFRSAMDSGQFKWGIKSKLVAGACLSIALREANLTETVGEIAYLVGQSVLSQTRVLLRVLDILALNLPPIDPVLYFPILKSHLDTILASHPSPIPSPLAQALARIPPHPIIPFAASLAAALPNILTPLHHPPHSAVPACAIFLLTLESLSKQKLPNYQALVAQFAHRLAVGSAPICAHYKHLVHSLAPVLEALPWASKSGIKVRGKFQRGKVDDRDKVATGLQDLVTFQGDVYAALANDKPQLELEVVDAISHPEPDHDATPPRPACTPLNVSRRAHGAKTHNPELDTFLLTCHDTDFERFAPSSSSAFRAPPQPTRLQILSSTVGGADGVTDQDLFEPGELDGYMRSIDERLHWEQVLADRLRDVRVKSADEQSKSRKRKAGEKAPDGKPLKRTKATLDWEKVLDGALHSEHAKSDVAFSSDSYDEEHETDAGLDNSVREASPSAFEFEDAWEW